MYSNLYYLFTIIILSNLDILTIDLAFWLQSRENNM